MNVSWRASDDKCFGIGIESKLEKNWSNLFKFQSISILAIRSNRRQETVSVP